MKKPKVYLVGAGPGDPGLITVRGLECIATADVVIYDYLAAPALLKHASTEAELIYVGKKGGEHTLPQEQINALLVAKARENKVVARLKTDDDEARITVGNLEVAQFIYLILNNQKIRDVINTITSKAVLILGRFTPERKVILDAMKGKLRDMNLLPIVFDFERSKPRDFTETVKILAGMSLFVIADITKPKSIPLELQAIVPDYQVPFVPIIQEGEKPFSMFNDLWVKYKWVLNPVDYPSADMPVEIFETAILERAWAKHWELQKAKTPAHKPRQSSVRISCGCCGVVGSARIRANAASFQAAN